MSTKIYSGYILDEGLDPFEMIPSLKKEFTNPIKKSIYEMYLRFFFRYYDLLTYNNGEVSHLLKAMVDKSDAYLPSELNIRSASLLARDEVEKWVKDEEHNYQVEIFFARDPETKRHLVYFMGNREMEDKFRKLDGVSEYTYYNNADEPEDVSWEEWEERGRAWERTVDLDAGLVNSMLSLQVLSSYDRTCNLSIPELMEFEPSFPNREERAEMLINSLLLEDYFKDNPELERNYMNIRKAQSETFKYNRLQAMVDKNLGEDLTPELLHQKIQESLAEWK